MSNDDFISNFYKTPSSPEKKKPAAEKNEPVPVKKETKKKEIFSDTSAQKANVRAEPLTEGTEAIKNTEIKSFEKHFEKLSAYHDEIHQSLQQIYEKLGQSHETIQTFLDNPQNFTDQQFLMIQQKREELQKNLLSKLTKEVRDSIHLRTQKERTKKRKTKTIGARKRWLTMD